MKNVYNWSVVSIRVKKRELKDLCLQQPTGSQPKIFLAFAKTNSKPLVIYAIVIE